MTTEKECTVKAVVFDMDGILFDSERIIAECLISIAAEEGWTVTWDTVHECVGTTRQETGRIIREEVGMDFPYQQIADKTEAKFRKLMATGGLPLKAGVLRLFDCLDSRGIPFGLATSTERSLVEEMLRIADLYGRFQSIVCGDEIPNSKPDPAIYEKSAEVLKVKPSELLIFEDSSMGISSGAAAGSRVVWVPDLQEVPTQIKELCFSEVGSLDAVCDRIEELLC